MSENKDAVVNGAFPLGPKNTVVGDYFTGKSYFNPLIKEDGVNEVAVNVSFEPGSRTFWHAHVGGYQMILATAGEGWYQEDGKPAQKLLPGDAVVAKDGVRHWHGAAQDSWFSHLVINSGETQWFEPVSEEQYAQLHKRS
ncbi:cupin domain-containing protein [Rothia terrae]|uniref:cupin domain-containing protein n=1 Tax=Rothia terrae TaxID=396015 RepID=UPI00340CD557